MKPILPERASGTFDIAAARRDHQPTDGTTYQVEVEVGLPVQTADFAATVRQVLSDERSWSAGGHRLVFADTNAEVRVVLASPETADELCAPLDTGGRLSCRNGRNVIINAWRWLNGAPAYRGRLVQYRQYVINHEVGHALGYPHQTCPQVGDLAPVMLQQTKGLAGCTANPWPARADLR